MHIELNISFHCLQIYCISACSPCFIVDSYHNTKESVHYRSLHTYLIVQFQYECLNSIQWETTSSTRVQWKYLGCLFSRLMNFTHLQSYLDHLCPLSPPPNHTQWFSFMYFVLKLESLIKIYVLLDCLMFPFIDLIMYFFFSLLM